MLIAILLLCLALPIVRQDGQEQRSLRGLELPAAERIPLAIVGRYPAGYA